MKNSVWKKWVAVAAAFAIVLSGAALLGRMALGDSAAVIALDVNPSIEIEINKREKVKEVRALNGEAVAVIGDMELEGVDLDVAVNAIIGSIVKNGYLSAERNSILISVDSNNGETNEKLRERLSREVGQLLEGVSIEASLITQSYDKGGEESAKADENGISEAKAALISKIVASGLLDARGVPYTYEKLAELNVNELKLILESKAQKIDGIEASGTASDKLYIPSEKALEIALADCSVAAEQISWRRIEMDYDDSARVMVYEVEFAVGEREYEYEINAESGAILDREIEQTVENDSSDGPVVSPSESMITRERALELAYADAGANADRVLRPEIELDGENGIYVYEVEFRYNGYEYEYKINAVSGAIIERESEPIDGKDGNGSAASPSENAISRERALELAYADAGVNADQVREVEIELDAESGSYIYEIDFKSGDMEYEYKLDAATGQILEREAERDD